MLLSWGAEEENCSELVSFVFALSDAAALEQSEPTRTQMGTMRRDRKDESSDGSKICHIFPRARAAMAANKPQQNRTSRSTDTSTDCQPSGRLIKLTKSSLGMPSLTSGWGWGSHLRLRSTVFQKYSTESWKKRIKQLVQQQTFTIEIMEPSPEELLNLSNCYFIIAYPYFNAPCFDCSGILSFSRSTFIWDP